MSKVQPGKMVSISYLLRDAADEIVEYSDLPVTYLHGGQHELFPQIVSALEGKNRARGDR